MSQLAEEPLFRTVKWKFIRCLSQMGMTAVESLALVLGQLFRYYLFLPRVSSRVFFEFGVHPDLG